MSALSENDPMYNLTDLAEMVAGILKRKMKPEQVIELLQVRFLEVEEAAELLRVKPATIRTWVQNDCIPTRRANGKIIFLLAELLEWTLPENDKHTRYRLATAQQCKLAAKRAAARLERSGL